MLFNSIAMAPKSRARQSPYVNSPANPAGEQDELADTQGPARGSNVGSNEAPTEAPTPLEAPILPLVPPPVEELFTKFMKVFIETTHTQTLAKLWERPIKIKTLENYWGKSHMECYHFY